MEPNGVEVRNGAVMAGGGEGRAGKRLVPECMQDPWWWANDKSGEEYVNRETLGPVRHMQPTANRRVGTAMHETGHDCTLLCAYLVRNNG